MKIDPRTPLKKATIPAGETLVVQGSPCKSLNILHQGEVEAMLCAKNTFLLGPDEIIPNSNPVFTIKGNSAIGPGSLVLGKPYQFSFRAKTDCVISTFTASHEKLPQILAGKINIGLILFRTLLTDLISLYNLNQRTGQLMGLAEKTNDNLALAYAHFNPSLFPENDEGATAPPQSGSIDPVLPTARIIVNEYRENGGEIPTPLKPAFMQGDYSSILKKSYEPEMEFDLERVNYYRRILKTAPEIQLRLYQSDIHILLYILKDVTNITAGLIKDYGKTVEGIQEMFTGILRGPHCWLEKYYLTADIAKDNVGSADPREFFPVTEWLLKVVEQLNGYSRQVLGSEITDISPRAKDLATLLENLPKPEAEAPAGGGETQVSVGDDPGGLLQELSNVPRKIMEFAGLPGEEQSKLVTDLAKYKNLKNPSDPAPEIRKLKRGLIQTYWKIYEEACLKYFNSGQARPPKYLELFFNYGFFDETMLDEEQIIQLADLRDAQGPQEFDTMRAHEFLKKIHDKEIVNSINDVGLSFVDFMRERESNPGYRKEEDLPPEINNGPTRVDFEINQVIQTTARLCSGSPVAFFPILSRDNFVMDINKMWTNPRKLADAVNKLLEIDYSLFYREVLLNDEKAGIFKEFVQTEVYPRFVIVPSVGSKMMTWMDLEGRSKQSPGRVFLPAFINADMFTMLLDAMGQFRWELCKTIQGVDWNNVGVPSLTSEYMDYIQFFRKSRDLSAELKEKIHTEMKKFRQDRDKFVNDYIRWIKNESRGVLKMNKVTRNIFYRHVPFAKNIREELGNQPAFADIANRFKNIRNRKLKELETRYKKYTKDGPLPALLQDNIDFFKV